MHYHRGIARYWEFCLRFRSSEPGLFDKIPVSARPVVSPSACSLRMANGDMSLSKGNAIFDLNFQGTKLSNRMTIADIEVPMISGYAFLYEHDCSISVKDSCLRLGNKNINVFCKVKV